MTLDIYWKLNYFGYYDVIIDIEELLWLAGLGFWLCSNAVVKKDLIIILCNTMNSLINVRWFNDQMYSFSIRIRSTNLVIQINEKDLSEVVNELTKIASEQKVNVSRLF